MTNENKIENKKDEDVGDVQDVGNDGDVVDEKNDKKIVKEKKRLFNRPCKNCQKAGEERDEYKAGWQRALADYKNLQTEIDKKRGEWAKMSEITVLEEFLPVYEHLKMAVGGAEEKHESGAWLEGVKFVLKQFQDILSQHGIEEIKTVGEQFNPNWHEAVGEEIIEDRLDGEIIKEVNVGYKLGDKILKAARVVVNKRNEEGGMGNEKQETSNEERGTSNEERG